MLYCKYLNVSHCVYLGMISIHIRHITPNPSEIELRSYSVNFIRESTTLKLQVAIALAA